MAINLETSIIASRLSRLLVVTGLMIAGRGLAETKCAEPLYYSQTTAGVQYCIDSRGLAYEFSGVLRTAEEANSHCDELSSLTKSKWFLPSVADVSQLRDTSLPGIEWLSTNRRINGRVSTPAPLRTLTPDENNFAFQTNFGVPTTATKDTINNKLLTLCMAYLEPPATRFEKFSVDTKDVQVKGLLKKTEFGTWSIRSYLPENDTEGTLKIFEADGSNLVEAFTSGTITATMHPRYLGKLTIDDPRSNPYYDDNGRYVGPNIKFASVSNYVELNVSKEMLEGLNENDFVLVFGRYSLTGRILEVTDIIKIPLVKPLPFQVCQAETKNFRSTEFGCMLYEDTSYRRGRIYFPWNASDLKGSLDDSNIKPMNLASDLYYKNYRTISENKITNTRGELSNFDPDVFGNELNRVFSTQTGGNFNTGMSGYCALLPKEIRDRVGSIFCVIGNLIPLKYNLGRPEVADVFNRTGEKNFVTSFLPLDHLTDSKLYPKFFSSNFPKDFRFKVSDRSTFEVIQKYKSQMWTAFRGQTRSDVFDAFEDPIKTKTFTSKDEHRLNIIASSDSITDSMQTLTLVNPLNGKSLTYPRYQCAYKRYITKGFPGESVEPGVTIQCSDTNIVKDTIGLIFSIDYVVSTLISNEIEAKPFYNPEGKPTVVNCQKFRTNALNALDVDGSGTVTPLDILIVINWLNNRTNPPCDAKYYLDVNGDSLVSPLDVLLIINALNQRA
jgi:hypothetical protein